MKLKAFLLIVALALFSLIGATASPKPSDSRDVVAHEWGTFTSIAGVNGEPVAWRSYTGTADLPCFVERFPGFKGGLSSTVRMETPVLYFYGQSELPVHVKVNFPKGTMTEWYPKATTSTSYNSLEWSSVTLTPGAKEDFPAAGGDSHYFAARATDAVPLKVGSQKEKFLFYRGAGTFPLPLSAKIAAGGEIVMNSIGATPVSGVILFENRGGKLRYRLVGALEGEKTFNLRLTKLRPLPGLLVDLEQLLVSEGLYPREARAMIETWRDSWFEEGTRLFYIVPRELIDSVLPLDIRPAASQITRVFVGRMEIITPAIQEEVRNAVANNDSQTLVKYGRFLEPIAQRLGLKSPFLNSVYQSQFAREVSCTR